MKKRLEEIPPPRKLKEERKEELSPLGPAPGKNQVRVNLRFGTNKH